jgi:xanthine dehydrogenase accessory factor
MGPRLDTSLEQLLERYALLSAPAALATLVATAGSTYRKAGARMLIESDGQLVGLLSGGCLEQDLREHALAVLAGDAARVVEYDMRGDDDLLYGIGAGCEGAMRILIEPAAQGSAAADALAQAGAATARGESVALAVIHEGPADALGTHAWTAGGEPPGAGLDAGLAEACATALATRTSGGFRWDTGRAPLEAWIEYLAPPPRLLICGAGPDAEPVAAQLRALRWAVTLVDHRPAYAVPARFAGATVVHAGAAELAARLVLDTFDAAVVMSHHLPSDALYLRALATSRVPYVGLLGPQPRRERLLAELGPLAGVLVPRLRGPVGLDIGAVTPEGIALAIAAELHAVVAGRGGGLLHGSSGDGR